jgi:hypothetical protein
VPHASGRRKSENAAKANCGFKFALIFRQRFYQMSSMRKLFFLLVAVLSGALGRETCADSVDPVASLRRFSDFKQVDAGRLLGGEILTERGALMNLRTGISTQACYAVPASPKETAKRLREWNPLPHPALNVYQFQLLPSPCTAADFKGLDFKQDKRAVRWLLNKTLAVTDDDSDLNLSRSEARELAGSLKKNSTPQEVSACWAKLLCARAAAFQSKGFDGLPPYEVSGETVSPASQLRLMLKEKERIAQEFDALIQKVKLAGGGASALTPTYYWNLFSSEGYGTLCLGATYSMPVGDHYQLLDVEYYVSGSYYASATFYEIWPIRAGDKNGSLVWRGDLFSAPGLAHTKGMERIAYGAIMLLEIKKGIRAFHDDIKASQ